MPHAFEYADAAHIVTLLLMYVRRILRSERVSQESLSIARGESKLISAYSKPVYVGTTFANNLYAELVENRRSQVRCCLPTTQDSSGSAI